MKTTKKKVPALNIMDYDRVIHLRYADLDGLSCSLLTYKAREGNIEHINAEDIAGVHKAIEELVAKGKDHKKGTLLILITGLYVNKEQSVQLDAVNTGNVDVRVMSTHYIRSPASEDYKWYYHNANVSATELLYAAIIESATAHISRLGEFVKVVSAFVTCNRSSEALFASGLNINNGLYMFLDKLKKDDSYTRDVAIGYLAEIAKVVEDGIYDWTSADIKYNVIRAWRKAVGAIDTETVADALVMRRSIPLTP